eukprot:g5389.t1
MASSLDSDDGEGTAIGRMIDRMRNAPARSRAQRERDRDDLPDLFWNDRKAGRDRDDLDDVDDYDQPLSSSMPGARRHYAGYESGRGVGRGDYDRDALDDSDEERARMWDERDQMHAGARGADGAPHGFADEDSPRSVSTLGSMVAHFRQSKSEARLSREGGLGASRAAKRSSIDDIMADNIRRLGHASDDDELPADDGRYTGGGAAGRSLERDADLMSDDSLAASAAVCADRRALERLLAQKQDEQMGRAPPRHRALASSRGAGGGSGPAPAAPPSEIQAIGTELDSALARFQQNICDGAAAAAGPPSSLPRAARKLPSSALVVADELDSVLGRMRLKRAKLEQRHAEEVAKAKDSAKRKEETLHRSPLAVREALDRLDARHVQVATSSEADPASASRALSAHTARDSASMAAPAPAAGDDEQLASLHASVRARTRRIEMLQGGAGATSGGGPVASPQMRVGSTVDVAGPGVPGVPSPFKAGDMVAAARDKITNGLDSTMKAMQARLGTEEKLQKERSAAEAKIKKAADTARTAPSEVSGALSRIEREWQTAVDAGKLPWDVHRADAADTAALHLPRWGHGGDVNPHARGAAALARFDAMVAEAPARARHAAQHTAHLSLAEALRVLRGRGVALSEAQLLHFARAPPGTQSLSVSQLLELQDAARQASIQSGAAGAGAGADADVASPPV